MTPVEIVPEQSDKPLEEDLSWEDKGEKIGDEIKVEKQNETGNFEGYDVNRDEPIDRKIIEHEAD